MRTILMDGDPGHDDVIAFLLALGNPSQLNIAGFTTVAGNSSAENCTAYYFNKSFSAFRKHISSNNDHKSKKENI